MRSTKDSGNKIFHIAAQSVNNPYPIPSFLQVKDTHNLHFVTAPMNPHLLLILWIVSTVTPGFCVPVARDTNVSSDPAAFDWKKVNPSPNLMWIPCFSGRECMRLEVPLDYNNSSGDKAAVAMIRVKAKVSPDSKEYRGPVLFNPGGPGLSGIEQVNARGDLYQQLLGNEYDILGFDPRGIGETTPQVSVFPDEGERAYWNAGEAPLINSTADGLARAFSRAQVFSELVELRSKKAAEHVSTAVVARDMLSINKAHGRDKLQYWGFSYGSVLGATFAAMFPGNVERLVIDGVVDFDDYYSGSFSTSLTDTDKALQFVYDKCVDAGPACPIYANSSALVRQRVDSIFSSIRSNPVPVINGSDYGLVDYNLLQRELYNSLYSPFTLFPLVAQALAALEKGDGILALTVWRMIEPVPRCDKPAPADSKVETRLATGCGEAQGVNNTMPDILQYFETQRKVSVFADVWTDTARTSCAGWKVRAKERFNGPFAVNTSFPMLIIGNTADPVTPLVGAQKSARTFGGSALLTVDTAGHTSEAAKSPCAQNVVRAYFQQGKLPNNGTVCGIEDSMFGGKPLISQNVSARGFHAGGLGGHDVFHI